MSGAPPEPLGERERALLAQGRHEILAAELAAAGRHAQAAWTLEQIWDFAGAREHYVRAGRPLDALRVAIELGRGDVLDASVDLFAAAPAEQRQQAAALLQRRGRHADAARVLAFGEHRPEQRAAALIRAGDRAAAARVLAAAGQAREALAALEPLPERHGPTLQLAAELAWALGDVEAAVRRAQGAIRAGDVDRPALLRLLSRGLAALGHELAAEIALPGAGEVPQAAPVPPRFQLRRPLAASYAGAAYEAIDRVTAQEVEVHLLLAELQEAGAHDVGVQDALVTFQRRAEAGLELAHPAVRPLVLFDAAAGLLVLPHAEGPALRSLIRPPGMPPARARALVAFLLDGLVAAHARGLVHGSLLPAQVVCDAAGRPLLGPFGADAIAGLVATRTGALEELLTITAPEVRTGAAATAASDVFSAAALFAALVTGTLGAGPAALPPAERALVEAALAEDPARRPDAAGLLIGMRRRVVDIRDLSLEPLPGGQEPGAMAEETGLSAQGVAVEAAASWTEEALEAVLACDAPALQPVLDRQGRRVALAPWPEGCRRLGDGASFAELARGTLAELPAAGAAALAPRLRASAGVVTPAGEWMLALDDVLVV